MKWKSSRDRKKTVGFGVATFVGVGIALVVTHPWDPGRDRPDRKAISRGPLTLHYVEPWHQVSAATVGTHGLRFSDPIAMQAPGESLVGGTVLNSAPVPGELPKYSLASFRSAPKSSSTRFGQADVMEYSGSAKNGDSGLTIYLVPTAAADIGLICSDDAGGDGDGDGEGCAETVETLRLSEVKSIPSGPDDQLAKALGRILEPVAAAHASPAVLSGSATAALAKSGERVAAVDLKADRRLDGVEDEPRTEKRVAALRDALAAEYQHLRRIAKWARRGKAAAYRRTAATLEADGHSVGSALKGLRSAGFDEIEPIDVLRPTPASSVKWPAPKVVGQPRDEGGTAGEESGGEEGGSSVVTPTVEPAGEVGSSTGSGTGGSQGQRQGNSGTEGRLVPAEPINSGGPS